MVVRSVPERMSLVRFREDAENIGLHTGIFFFKANDFKATSILFFLKKIKNKVNHTMDFLDLEYGIFGNFFLKFDAIG